MSPEKRSSGPSFSKAEQEAMKARVEELKAAGQGKGATARAREEQAALKAIAELPEPDKTLAERVHRIVLEAAPELAPRTWYGMLAYAKDGDVLCFLQAASKFDTRYATLGFNDVARLDDGPMWPSAYAIGDPDKIDEQRIAELIKKAVGESG